MALINTSAEGLSVLPACKSHLLVRLIVGNHLRVPTLSILPQSDFWKDLGADEVDGTELIMVAEEYFDIQIHEDEAVKIRTVQDMVQVVQAKICP